ncbi:hypothetical protein [Salinilacihabitans rarus]|uniref:hypothetical protein n=1 Tax=Salinilacihabitans rarus TaxID=2961596 RepID=UPI0020C8D661|nr:hypothetical protein [Salinilacihabitans rarus]
MTSYDEIRLEAPTGEYPERVVAYFAPTFEVTPQHSNDPFESARGGDRAGIVRDNGLWQSSVSVHGTFHHSDHVPPAFRDALQQLFGQQTVTPTDQINRLVESAVYAEPGHYHFYHNENEYTAEYDGDVDVANNVYPAVVVQKLQVPEQGETSGVRADFQVELGVGVRRASAPEVTDG